MPLVPLVQNEMRIQATDRRERRWEMLVEATNENTKSGALDVATAFYLKMAGDNMVAPSGAFVELMEAAEERGSLTAPEISEILDTNELQVKANTLWSVGEQ